MEEIAIRREAIRLKKLELTENGEETKKVEFTEPPTSEVREYPAAEDVVEEEPEEKHSFLAFARIFSGTLRKGQTLFVLSPKHSPEELVNKGITLDSSLEEIAAVSKHVTKFTVNDIYLMMGRELELIDRVPAGK